MTASSAWKAPRQAESLFSQSALRLWGIVSESSIESSHRNFARLLGIDDLRFVLVDLGECCIGFLLLGALSYLPLQSAVLILTSLVQPNEDNRPERDESLERGLDDGEIHTGLCLGINLAL